MLRPAFMLMFAALSLQAGCSTIESRIEEQADLFATLPPDTQERLRAGGIAIGDTKDMVYIALGQPDGRFSRTDATGIVYDIWSYAGVYYTRDMVWTHPSPFRHGRHDFYRTGPEYVDVQHEYERVRIEFEGDKVKAIERAER